MAMVERFNVLEILKRAKSGGEIVPWNQDVRNEAIRRGVKAGHCNNDVGQAGKGDMPRPVSEKFGQNFSRIFGESKLNLWPRDENGNLIE